MEQAIKEWAEFIKKTTNSDVKLIECVRDNEHTQKFTPGKYHIYSFWLIEGDRPLKIGIAGPKSAARFSSHHYYEKSSNSNLAKSLMKSGLCKDDPKSWIKNKTYRINAVFDDFSKPLAHALEAHLHLLYKPRFEK